MMMAVTPLVIVSASQSTATEDKATHATTTGDKSHHKQGGGFVNPWPSFKVSRGERAATNSPVRKCIDQPCDDILQSVNMGERPDFREPIFVLLAVVRIAYSSPLEHLGPTVPYQVWKDTKDPVRS